MLIKNSMFFDGYKFISIKINEGELIRCAAKIFKMPLSNAKS